MIKTFKDKITEALFDGINNKQTRRIPRELHHAIQEKLDYLNYASSLEDLRFPPSNRLEALTGNLKDYYSIRINQQWRIIFNWQAGFADNVQVIDYH